jgi:hypothetical protein
LLSPLVCVALAAPFIRGKNRRDVQVLALWAAVLIGFYAFYYHTGETWWYLRFILPAFPILILGMLVVFQKLPIKSPFYQTLILAGVLAVVATWELKLVRRLNAAAVIDIEHTYPLISDWTQKNLPPESAIFSMQVSGALYYYTDFLLTRWDQIENGRVEALISMLQEKHRPIYAVLYEYEIKDALDRLGGEWKKIGKVGQATIWQRQN